MAIPHLRIPFRINSSGAADVVEQDSLDEVAQCVEVLLSTRAEDRPEVLDYGIDEPLFASGSPQKTAQATLAKIEKWESRAIALVRGSFDPMADLTELLKVEVKIYGG